jgi:hypothetical protein
MKHNKMIVGVEKNENKGRDSVPRELPVGKAVFEQLRNSPAAFHHAGQDYYG